MAAYGLYTHIASNKLRSLLLLGGLFLLIYVLVFAGALVADMFLNSDRPLNYYLTHASRDLIAAFPYATALAVAWIVIAYFFHQNMIDAVTGAESVTRQQEPRLYNLLENLCISRGIPMPKLKIMDSPALNAFASGLNRQQYSITVTTGLLKALKRPGDRGGAGSRAHPYPQWRRAADGGRRHHCRRGRLLWRNVLPPVHQSAMEFVRQQRLVLVIFIVLLFLLVEQRQQELRRRRGHRGHCRDRADRAGLAVVAGGETGAVALARISRRRRLRGADQESRRDDHGAAQDRGPRRAAGSDFEIGRA